MSLAVTQGISFPPLNPASLAIPTPASTMPLGVNDTGALGLNNTPGNVNLHFLALEP